MNLLCIDVSYVIFYRYNALRTWYKHKHHEDVPDEYIRSDDFRTMLHKRLRETLFTFVKMYPTHYLLLAYDGHKNWRKTLCDAYKSNRIHTPLTLELFRDAVRWLNTNATACLIEDIQLHNTKPRRKHTSPHISLPIICHLFHNALEADDLIHMSVIMHHESTPSAKSVIIANDHDYLPLLRFPHVTIVNLQKKILELPTNIAAHQMLMYKVLIGDKSDNIPPALPRCGKKTALKYIQNPIALKTAFEKHPDATTQYEQNVLLMDNTRIPHDLQTWISDQLLTQLFVQPS